MYVMLTNASVSAARTVSGMMAGARALHPRPSFLLHPRASFLLTVSLIALAGAPARAQSVQEGLGGGVNWSTVSNLAFDVPATTTGFKPSLQLGGYLIVPIRRRRTVGFQPELLYTRKGLRGHDPDANTLSVSLDYIEVPLLLRLGTEGRAPGVFVVAGPGVSVLVRAHRTIERADGFDDTNIRAQTTGSDVNVIAGAGLATGEFTAEGRVDAGLRGTGTGAAGVASRTRTISVLFHVLF
jgi:hypothetical protein